MGLLLEHLLDAFPQLPLDSLSARSCSRSWDQLADALLLECHHNIRQDPPLRMVLTGEPGTGKSQALKAFQWFALQHDASHMLLVAAFTWRAALLVATLRHPPQSTSMAFAVNPLSNRIGDCSANIDGVRFICVDEYSFLNLQHFSSMSTSIRRALNIRAKEGTAFADLHVILVGDLCQHRPVSGQPLYIDRQPYLSADERTATTAYDNFDRVIMLTQQQRITATTDPLFRYSRLFIRDTPPSKAEIAEFCDALNSKVVTKQDFDHWASLGQVPRVVCLRNDVRKQLNWALAKLHAQHLKVRPIVWFAHDIITPSDGRRLPTQDVTNTTTAVPRVVKDAMMCMKPEDTEDVPSMQMFFPGCIYLFNDNAAPQAGFVNNAECIGVDILLQEGEADDMRHDCWFLKKPPAAIFVRPVDAKVSNSTWDLLRQAYPTLPQGCLPVIPGWTDTFSVKYYYKHPETQSEMSAIVKVRRFGFNLSDGYAVTDYYCQGLNFKSNPWLAHLNPPPTGKPLTRPALFVVLTRWSAWADVRLLCPLWPAGDTAARLRIINAFHKLACLEPDLKAEIVRLRSRAAQARVSFNEQWNRACAAAVVEAPPA